MKVLENTFAERCPPCGGPAVYRARSMYALHDRMERFTDGQCLQSRSMGIVDEEQREDVFLRPNPTSGDFILTMEANMEIEDREMTVFNFTGQPIAQRTLPTGGFEEKVTIPGLRAGSYLVVIMEDGKKVASERLVIVK